MVALRTDNIILHFHACIAALKWQKIGGFLNLKSFRIPPNLCISIPLDIKEKYHINNPTEYIILYT